MADGQAPQWPDRTCREGRVGLVSHPSRTVRDTFVSTHDGPEAISHELGRIERPIVIAITGFAVVLAIAAIGDIKTMFAGGISGAPRIARHLWRMCLGLTLATGSAFTNGFARLLPALTMYRPRFSCRNSCRCFCFSSG
ncbi:MAG: hypothetical protein WDM89_16075 [Rhizomicrobium sp.]